MDVLIVDGIREVAQNIESQVCEVLGSTTIRRTSSIATAYTALTNREPVRGTIVFACVEVFSPEDLAHLAKLCLFQPEKVRVIAVGAPANHQQVLSVIRCGAIDYLDHRCDNRQVLRDVLQRIEKQDRNKSRLGTTIACVSPVGGAGTSVLACNIAATFAKKAGACGLIDLHLRRGMLASLLNLSPKHSLTALLGKASQLDAVMLAQSLSEHPCGIHLLAGADSISDRVYVSSDVAKHILDLTREKFAKAVVELGDLDPGDELRTLACVDRIVIVLRPDYVSLSRGKQCLEWLTRGKIPEDRVTVVVNRVGQQRELPPDCMAKALGLSQVFTIANDPSAVVGAYNLGIPFVCATPDAGVSKEVRNLCAHLVGEEAPEAAVEAATSWIERARSHWNHLRRRAAPTAELSLIGNRAATT